MRAFLICLALCVPNATRADCPTAKSDLAKGIYLTADGTQSIRYRSDAQGYVLVESFPMGDFAFSYLATTMFGVYQLQEGTAYKGETLPDSLARMGYAVPSGNLPEPTPGLAFHSPVKVNDDPISQTMFVTVGLPVQKTFGDCAYETLPVVARMVGESEDYLSRLDYIPSLGFAVEWMHGTFADMPSTTTTIRLDLTAPDGMPPP